MPLRDGEYPLDGLPQPMVATRVVTEGRRTTSPASIALLKVGAPVGSMPMIRGYRFNVARAVASPWLPPDAVTMPRASSSLRVVSSLFVAPRALNDPDAWRCSSFRNSRTSAGCARRLVASMTGLSRIDGAIRSCAARIA